jgi:hypothetical protein
MGCRPPLFLETRKTGRCKIKSVRHTAIQVFGLIFHYREFVFFYVIGDPLEVINFLVMQTPWIILVAATARTTNDEENGASYDYHNHHQHSSCDDHDNRGCCC